MLVKLKSLLTALTYAFQFLERRRQRLEDVRVLEAEERAAERQHQLLVMQSMFSGLLDVVKANQEGLLEIAKAQTAQAQTITEWLKSFQVSTPPEPPMSVEQTDSWIEEQKARALAGDPEAFAGLPPEFQLAAVLNRLEGPDEHFDREGSDFN